MIVYGDPQYEDSMARVLAELRARLERVLRKEGAGSLEELRTLLIQAGQLEQAAVDALPGTFPVEEANQQEVYLQAITDEAAVVFYTRWLECSEAPDRIPGLYPALLRMREALDQIQALPGDSLTVKVPEGFAFYGLYPEQYCAAALRWISDHATSAPRKVAVVGIRSIGTTLSALAAAVLAAAGWEVRRLTVRPSGHPFSRTVEIPPGRLNGAVWGLVVDEGPGLSGSSMAAAAQALADSGIDPACISFLPGHGGEPGSAASENVRAWWSRTPRYTVPLTDLRWNGLSLPEILAAETVALLGEPVERVEDLGGGLWRHAVYTSSSDWPPAFVPFERPKYRCTTGSGKAILWKFAGLAPPGVNGSMGQWVNDPFTGCRLRSYISLERDLAPGVGERASEDALLAARAAGGWTPPPLGTAFGFVASDWLEDAPLHASADPDILDHLGRYVAAVAGPPLSETEGEAGFARLGEMLYWNTWEALGEAAAARTQEWSESAAKLGKQVKIRSYGDGRMAPYEWRRTGSGQILKLDSAGHTMDHTTIGPQPLAWDLAGAMVEWGLNDASASPLLAAFQEASGQTIPSRLLTFYRMAYAAFRMGQSHLCAGISAHDPGEEARLQRAYTFYREELERMVGTTMEESGERMPENQTR